MARKSIFIGNILSKFAKHEFGKHRQHVKCFANFLVSFLPLVVGPVEKLKFYSTG